MKIPSVKTMVKHGFTLEQAKQIRQLMEKFRENNSYHVIPTYTLQKISDIIDGFGMESIQEGNNSRSPAIYYVNMGDTYDTTILWVNGNFRVGSWGDIVERGNYN